MIDQIKGIRIQGKCFTNKTDFIFFTDIGDRIGLVYGKNGSGKSTISEGINISSNKHICDELTATFLDEAQHELELPDIQDKVFVFNENYIDRNIKIDDDGLGTIILFGKQADIQSEIDACEKEIEIVQNEYTKAYENNQQYLKNENILSPQYHWLRIQEILKKPGGWAEQDSKLKGNRRNASVTDGIINDICTLSPSKTYEELIEEFKRKKILYDKLDDTTTSYPNKIEQIFLPTNWESEICNLLAKKIDQPCLSEREKQILTIIQSNGQTAIEDARRVFSKDNTTFCPYCFRPIDKIYKSELLESINRVLNKDTDEHIEELSKITFPTFENDYVTYNLLDGDLVNQIHVQISACEKLLKKYADAISIKRNKIYTPLNMSENGLYDEIKNLNSLLLQLEKKRTDFNAAYKQKNSILNELLNINKQIAHMDV
ncbi:MAG: AAA family ATPase, partial [Clostridia bacterium]|nr:AAA family ATPase [Clostridia bacterium]